MTQLTARLDGFENRLRSMETELTELRRLARAEEAVVFVPEPEPLLWERAEPELQPPPAPVPPQPREVLREPRPPRDFSVLLGARALAWTGGAVSLLGIVFFFVLAVERGWIGPSARVALGALVSAALVGTGVWVRRAYGETYASVSAAGAGIAGLYATLLATDALYHLVSSPVALAAALAIAATGAAVALAWRTQTLAVLGLVGAMLVPVPIALQGSFSALGTSFAALVLAAATVVAVRLDWRGLLVTGVVATAPQALLLVADHRPHATAVALAVWLIYAAGAVCLALRTRLTYLPASLLVFSAAFGGLSAGILFDGRALGVALLGVAAAYAVSSVLVLRRDRDTASVLWAVALTIAAVAAASLVSGATLTIVWAGEAAMLAWLARRISEPRFQLASLAWLALAFTHGLEIDAPFRKLFVENGDAWRATASAAALAVATALVGLATFEWEPRPEGALARIFADLQEAQPWLRRGAYALAASAAVYAASLGLVTVPASWGYGHVAVAALWSLVAVGLALGRFRVSSLVAAAASVMLVLLYDLPSLPDTPRAWAFAIVAAACLAVALAYELRSTLLPVEVPSLAGLVASAGLASSAIVELLDGRTQGAALLALAAVYAATGVALLRRRRDFATALGVVSLALAAPATVLVLDGTWIVLAWAATATGLALLARYEERLVYGALAYLGLALGDTLALQAQPTDVFVAHSHPGAGAPAVLLVLAGAAVLAWTNQRLRAPLTWVCGALGLYAATLAILEASEDLGGGLDTAFQRGHTAVSTLWGMVGLTLLYLGLKRASRGLQIGGFALFGISLAKLFVYDLSFLSSVARAFSFLAVGAVILVGGFFYQRMANIDSRA